MKKAIKQKWVKALRSGKYKQGREALRNPKNEYCCLGVLCDIYAKENKNAKWEKREHEEFFGADYVMLGTSTDLPGKVMHWAGLQETIPKLKVGDSTQSLADLNDEGENFKVIATLIEEKL